MIRYRLIGYDKAQRAMLKTMAAVRPDSIKAAVRDAIIIGHRHATGITHVDTGALRASHAMRFYGLSGDIYLNPSVRNPRSGQRAAVYGGYEHARGGEHAFYARTIREAGNKMQQAAMSRIRSQLP